MQALQWLNTRHAGFCPRVLVQGVGADLSLSRYVREARGKIKQDVKMDKPVHRLI